MTRDEDIRGRLEVLLESGGTPEAACADRPDLIAEVRRRWREVRWARAEVEAMFPAGWGEPPGDAAPALPGYDEVSYLGRGGMGVVYRARHRALGRVVAVKMLRTGPAEGPGEAEAILREASAVASLRHPNIVQVFDVGVHEGRAYFTMEFLEGGTLAEKLRGQPQPPRSAAGLARTLAAAVAAAHAGGIVHRDLKPGNILFTGDGVPKVADFSLARRIAFDPGVTDAQAGVGTPSYMAPEQVLGGPGRCAAAVDVYALGAVLYELVTGRPPFRADTRAETHRQAVEEDPAPPSRLNASVPRDLETIALTCLRKDPARRYASAAALGEDLERYLDGRPIAARRAWAGERAVKWARRRPARAALLLVALLAGAAAVGGASWVGSRRAAAVAAAENDLARIRELEESGQFEEAGHLVELARARLAGSGPAGLHERLERAAADVELAGRLEAVRMDRAASGEVRFDRAAFGRRYEELLRGAGYLGPAGEGPSPAAERIRRSPVRAALLSALNDWAFCSTDRGDLQYRLDLARRADPDPAWRDRVRDVTLWSDTEALRDLAARAPMDAQSVTLAPILVGLLWERGEDPVGLLRRVQAANPSDFWANFNLAEHLDTLGDPGAVGFYRAAQALRPRSAAALVNLGTALSHHGQEEEAARCWERALALDAECAPALANLAVEEDELDHMEKARDLAERACRSAPRWPFPALLLARAHAQLGDPDRALAVAENALTLLNPADPLTAEARRDLARYRRLSAVAAALDALAGRAREPEDAEEAFMAAGLLLAQRRAGPAARLAARAVELDAAGAADPKSLRRYRAAVAAVALAGEPATPDAERAEHLGRAVQWLTQDLAAWEGLPAERDTARRVLRSWWSTPALVGLREPAAALPPGVGASSRELWSRVRAALSPGRE